MDESYYRDRISGYFDRSLPPDEQALVEEYLKNSEEGQRLLAELGRLDEFVRLHDELSGEDDFWEQKAQTIEARLGFGQAVPGSVTDISSRAGKGFWWKLSAAAASIAFLVFIGLHQTDIFEPEVEDGTGVQVRTPRPQTQEGIVTDSAPAEPTAEKGPAVHKGDNAEKKTPDDAPDIGIPTPVDVLEAEEPKNERQAELASTGQTTEPVLDDEVMREITAGLPDQSSRGDITKEREVGKAMRAGLPAAPSEAAESSGVADTGTALAHWRAEYAAAVEAVDRKDQRAAKPSAKVPAESAFMDRDQTSSETSAIEESERKLVEACFQIALLSPDADERRDMIGWLERLTERSAPSTRQYARNCLDSLQAVSD